jgi:threonine dehydrogenase-like Zn-dependent dehydrogenase
MVVCRNVPKNQSPEKIMRAVWYEKTGSAHAVLMLGEPPTPQPAPGELRIRLAASGVNLADCNRRAGTSPMDAPLAVQLARWGGARVIATVGTFPLGDTAAVHKAVEAGGKRGTVVVTIGW